MTDPRTHKINYVEFPAKGKIAEMKAFYGSVFGWSFQDWGEGYASFSPKEAGIDGGFDGETASSPDTGTLIVLYSDKLDETYKAVAAAGAQIKKEIFEFPGGRRFHFLDPAGNELAVWTETGEEG